MSHSNIHIQNNRYFDDSANFSNILIFAPKIRILKCHISKTKLNAFIQNPDVHSSYYCCCGLKKPRRQKLIFQPNQKIGVPDDDHHVWTQTHMLSLHTYYMSRHM